MSAERLIKSNYVFISSEQAVGPANEFSCNIPEDSIKAAANQYIRLTLCQHSIVNNIWNVTANHSQIKVGNNTQTLESGFWTVYDLEAEFNRLFNASVYIVYKHKLNRFEFTPKAGPVTISFQGNLSKLFGVPRGQNLVVNTVTKSPTAVSPQPVTDLVIHLTHMVVDTPMNLSNLDEPELNASSILAVIPLRAAPRALNSWSNYANAYDVSIFDTDPQRIGFRVTDQNGVLIEDLPDWSAVIKVDILQAPDADESLTKLESIQEYLRLIFLSNNLKDGKDDQQERMDLQEQSNLLQDT